jgi:MoxR-like ATPase
MKEIKPGYIFTTVFWIEKGDDGKPEMIGRNINSKITDMRIITEDRRVMPGRNCTVKVESVSDKEIRVDYLGLSDFRLQDDIFIEPSQLKQFEILLCSGRSILLEGPQGAGKTTISRALAETLGMEYVFFNCSVCFEPADFVGSLQLIVDSKGKARTEWIPTPVLETVYAAGENSARRFLVFLDELNRCRSYALNGIMSAIDASKMIFDPRNNSYIPIPDNIQWIAAINSGKQFTGTYKLDVAQLDRFAVLKIGYPPEEKEIGILSRRYDMVKPKYIQKAVQIANAIRNEEAILSDLSMRATDEVCMFLSYPSFQKSITDDYFIEIMKTSFCNRLPGDIDEEGSEARMAYTIIERHVRLPKEALE